MIRVAKSGREWVGLRGWVGEAERGRPSRAESPISAYSRSFAHSFIDRFFSRCNRRLLRGSSVEELNALSTEAIILRSLHRPGAIPGERRIDAWRRTSNGAKRLKTVTPGGR